MSPTNSRKLSVIIPTLNEEEFIGKLLQYISENSRGHVAEIIVVDANSEDNTEDKAIKFGAVVIKSAKACRAYQMNRGAEIAKGDILYFVHADAFPPKTFAEDILQAAEKGIDFGCYRFRFKSANPLLRINSFFTRFKFLWCRGGDQTLFIKRDIFEAEGKFNEKYVVMEDFELIQRLWKKYKFTVLPKSVMVSARKYKINGYFQVNIANLIIFRLFKKGRDPKELKEKYHQLIKHPKDQKLEEQDL